jgi:uncharacterized membrane protein YqhA
MTDPAQTPPAPERPADHPAKRAFDAAERNVPRTRYVFLFAILSAILGSVVLLIMGFVETVQVVVEIVRHPAEMSLNTVRLHFIHLIDTFLLATILYVFGAGFAQLLGSSQDYPAWMKIETVADLEHKLTGVLITVLGVIGLSVVAQWDGQTDLLGYGVTVALLIAALAFFYGKTDH